MQQPELGKRLTALRKEKNLTQEELVEKSNVSVRTIQRIEAGEVMPRTITIKILLEALGENWESFNTPSANEETNTRKNILPMHHRNTLLLSVLGGAVYLITQIILGVMDIIWFKDGHNWGLEMNAFYIVLELAMVLSFVLFASGFLSLSKLFENALLKIAIYLLLAATAAHAVLDVSTLNVQDPESVAIFYVALSIIMGVLSILFGIALLRLQDGMGELSRIAGILEITLGCLLLTVILFFVSFIILIPAIMVEMLLLYRGYEYLSKSQGVPA